MGAFCIRGTLGAFFCKRRSEAISNITEYSVRVLCLLYVLHVMHYTRANRRQMLENGLAVRALDRDSDEGFCGEFVS